MCTLIALHRAVPGAPLVVAANRDEYYDRPAEGPAVRRLAGGVVLAPLDRRAGGTWLGLNASGLFAAVTNLAGGQPDPRRRSRGWLVSDALQFADAVEAAERTLADIEERSAASEAYNPFNLFVADARRAWSISYDGSLCSGELGSGVHVIGNAAPGQQTPKLARLRERAQRAADAPAAAVLEELAALCRGHEGGDPFQDACVHTERYGTRSSTLLRLDRQDASGLWDGVLRYAEGAPCRAEYEDFTPLLRELGRGSRLAEGAITARKVS